MSHRLGFLFSTLICSAFAVPVLAQRPPLIDPVSGHTYLLSPTVELWDVADTQAKSMSMGGYQGHLVTIGSTRENNLVLEFWAPEFDTIWIGLSDINALGTPLGSYQWSNGEPLVYTNWRPGEPNNSLGREHYVQMVENFTGDWNDLPNDSPLNFVIEFDTPLAVPLVPEPGTVALTASLMAFGTALVRRRKRTR